MAWGNYILDSGFDAAAALTKYQLVKLSAAETVTPVTAITDIPIGVSQFDVSAGDITKGKGASIRVMGVSEVVASGAISVGVRCQMETTGRVSAEVGASGKRLVGICVGHPSTNAGDRITMLFLAGLGLA